MSVYEDEEGCVAGLRVLQRYLNMMQGTGSLHHGLCVCITVCLGDRVSWVLVRS